ncbi:MAG: hypothetical protein ATN36_05195 [Epulopiscium sp. Nele67-Bin005]|nr:MAG: hypothetical protein ATN36_05195 [Epulopiscium sp. Nele67-Bin005]
MVINGNFGTYGMNPISANNLSINSKPVENDDAMQGFGNIKDTLSISSEGHKLSQMDNLMKQKNNIMENKNDFLFKALEEGTDPEILKKELEEFDEKIAEIEDEINNLNTEEAKKQQEQLEEMYQKSKEEAEKNKPKTEDEIMQDRMNGVISMSNGVSQMQVTNSVRTQSENKANILESQAKGDSGVVREKKLEEASNLKNVASNMSSQLGEQLEKVNSTIDNSPTKVEEDSKDSTDPQ